MQSIFTQNFIIFISLSADSSSLNSIIHRIWKTKKNKKTSLSYLCKFSFWDYLSILIPLFKFFLIVKNSRSLFLEMISFYSVQKNYIGRAIYQKTVGTFRSFPSLPSPFLLCGSAKSGAFWGWTWKLPKEGGFREGGANWACNDFSKCQGEGLSECLSLAFYFNGSFILYFLIIFLIGR